jgi:hypothetical protein
MVHTGAVDFSSFGFDDFAEPEEKYAPWRHSSLAVRSNASA